MFLISTTNSIVNFIVIRDSLLKTIMGNVFSFSGISVPENPKEKDVFLLAKNLAGAHYLCLAGGLDGNFVPLTPDTEAVELAALAKLIYAAYYNDRNRVWNSREGERAYEVAAAGPQADAPGAAAAEPAAGRDLAQRHPREKVELIHHACEMGYASAVDAYLNAGGDPNKATKPRKRGVRSQTPLSCAFRGGHTAIVDMLLKAGATVDGNSLLAAVQSGKKEIVDQVLKAGAELFTNKDKCEALAEAGRKELPESASVLVAHGAKIVPAIVMLLGWSAGGVATLLTVATNTEENLPVLAVKRKVEDAVMSGLDTIAPWFNVGGLLSKDPRALIGFLREAGRDLTDKEVAPNPWFG